VLGWDVPAAQEEHEDWPMLDWYVPAEHAVHEAVEPVATVAP
jgi:hypothetical protein